MLRENTTFQFLRSKPLFLFLLPIFFVLHGFTANYDSVPAGDALLLAVEYIVITLAIAFLSWLFYRDIFKASLLALLIMSYQFFFSNLLDVLKSNFAASFLLRYRFLLPFSVVFFVAIFIWLKRRKKLPPALISYLNMLFVVILMIDTGRLIIKIPAVNKKKAFHPSAEGFTICDSCSKPDIFLIIPDQYTGNSALKEIFQFDNSRFENELKLRGFHISEKSSSNYNFTPFSVASTLNMSLLSLQKGQQTYETVHYSYDIIRTSLVLKFLVASGYRFYNCSIFDFDGQPAYKYAAFLPYGINLITSQTFTGRLSDDFRQDVLEGKLPFKELRKKLAYENLSFNDDIINLTVKTARQKSQAPKFVYTHLMMPHYPYYFDSTANPLPLEKLTDRKKVKSNDYIEYLVYSNKKLLKLVDDILSSSASPPIIIVLSDHGLRHPEKNIDPAYDFINLNAVYFPNKNYSLFYDSITNLNEFRVIFNSYFHQHLPLLKDSTTSLRDD